MPDTTPSTQKKSMDISQLNEFFKNLPALDPEDLTAFEEDLKQIRLDNQ